jgi:two-component system response regulator AtoC
MSRALLLCSGETIHGEHLGLPEPGARPRSVRGTREVPTLAAPTPAPAPLSPPPIEERQRVLDALTACAGNQTQAAQRLGISRRTLINRILEYGLPRPRRGTRSPDE